MPLFALTIFVSSFLLFLVQPMIARMILPWFGGTAAVWGTCLVFFQVVLLAGYAYSHYVVERLNVRAQRLLHGGLLLAGLLFLPLAPSLAWKPTGTEDPIWRILGLLTVSIGLPYFLLSTTGPLMQAWFVQFRPGAIPYRLFALSNVGSMLALLSYPTLIEPALRLSRQSLLWSLGFGLFVACCIGVGFWSLMRSKTVNPAASEADLPESTPPRPQLSECLEWIAYAACPSLLLLAMTSHLTQDVAAIPFLWVLPLALYLLSFILCFDAPRWYQRWLFFPLGWVALFGSVIFIYREGSIREIKWVVITLAAFFFILCMVCHGELSRRKPHPRYLTLFFLMVSVGGALGGLFVALIAPLVFKTNYELPIGLGMATYLLIMATGDAVSNSRLIWLRFVSLGFGVIFFLVLGYWLSNYFKNITYMTRSFYGELRIRQLGDELDWNGHRTLLNGTINHGAQFIHPKRRDEISTYYCPSSGVGMVMRTLAPGPQKVGVIGLGTGTLTAFGRPGDTFRVYEINPTVVRLAREYFFHLTNAKANVEIVMGDARLSLEREEPQNYDILAVDAFSSDAIPVHLLTAEAIQLYFRHLKPDGVLVIHVSNRNIELEPVLEQLALRIDRRSATIDDPGDPTRDCYSSNWVVLTSRTDILNRPEFLLKSRPPKISTNLPLWTDDYSNLFRLLK